MLFYGWQTDTVLKVHLGKLFFIVLQLLSAKPFAHINFQIHLFRFRSPRKSPRENLGKIMTNSADNE